MAARSTDVLVIGTGPGGEGAAMQLTKGGKEVIVIEKHSQIGGGCTHWGTIPSKALRFSITQLTEALSNQHLQETGVKVNPSVAELRKSAQSIISKQETMRKSFYVRNNVELIHGHAEFINQNTLRVNGGLEITAEHIIIATGSRPYRPEEVDFTHPRVFDSDTILSLEHKPRSMTVYGAGVIGCEYASMFRNLDIKINLINTREKLLEFLDDEISDALSYHFRERGVLIRHNEKFSRLETADDGVVMHLESGKQVKTDILLWAAGRTGNTDKLGLENAGLEPNRRGYLNVTKCYQTDIPCIYAVGDVVGFPSLASAAYTQGRLAANHILGKTDRCELIGDIPSGIYTSPEISSIGRTEKELTDLKVPYEVGHTHFKSLARAQITGRSVGMLKILFHRETLEILGVHCFGPNAAEIIHIGQAIMAQKGSANSLNYFMNATFNYPTMAEAYRVAALNGFNRLF
jgi:NAD(P) transhydrogenase